MGSRMLSNKLIVLVPALLLGTPVHGVDSPQRAPVDKGVAASTADVAKSQGDWNKAPSFRLQYIENRLSVSAHGVPLVDVLREISRQTGIEIKSAGAFNARVSVEFSDQPLDAGIRKLLSNLDYIIVGNLSPGNERGTVLLWVRQEGANGHLQGSRIIQWGQALLSDQRPGNKQTMKRVFDSGSTPAASLAGDSLSDTQWQGEPDDTQSVDEETAADTNPNQRLSEIRDSFLNGDEDALSKAVKDENPVVQASAFEALNYLDRDGAVSALQSAMESDHSATRLEALQLLESTPSAAEGTVLAALDRALKDEDTAVRLNAVQALADREGNDVVDLLRNALQDSDPSVRIAVLSIAAEKHRSLLYQALSDQDESVRTAANAMLQSAGNDR
jgi:hypothetical protein